MTELPSGSSASTNPFFDDDSWAPWEKVDDGWVPWADAVARAPDEKGVYLFRSSIIGTRGVVYIGKADNAGGLKQRLRRYHHPGHLNATSIRVRDLAVADGTIEVGWCIHHEPAALERYLLKRYRRFNEDLLPRWNRQPPGEGPCAEHVPNTPDTAEEAGLPKSRFFADMGRYLKVVLKGRWLHDRPAAKAFKTADSSTPVSNVEDRLRVLDRLRANGKVTTEEYEAKRRAIIDSL